MVMELLARLSGDEGRTVVVATHSDGADPHARRLVRLGDGLVLEDAWLG
jgi:ABC-type lipoprotein export system ATPase subunit